MKKSLIFSWGYLRGATCVGIDFVRGCASHGTWVDGGSL